ncbi:MAG: hypothetical protein PHI71_10550 [Acidiphilium sp.]|nr:hypothetical protein [Acidiphilium sp.]
MDNDSADYLAVIEAAIARKSPLLLFRWMYSHHAAIADMLYRYGETFAGLADGLNELGFLSRHQTPVSPQLAKKKWESVCEYKSLVDGDVPPDTSKMSERMARTLTHPACSFWLKNAIISGVGRDPFDAARDAELLAELLGEFATTVLTASNCPELMPDMMDSAKTDSP